MKSCHMSFRIALAVCIATVSYADIVTREIAFVKDDPAEERLTQAVRSQFPPPKASPITQFNEWNEEEKIEVAKHAARVLTSGFKTLTKFKLEDIIFAVKCLTSSESHVFMKLKLTDFCVCKKV
ncbi:hypothetical protein D918_05216 [Trichuris suis]|nr:hypothetical protein D918_05216 [Trichuris suis]